MPHPSDLTASDWYSQLPPLTKTELLEAFAELHQLDFDRFVSDEHRSSFATAGESVADERRDQAIELRRLARRVG